MKKFIYLILLIAFAACTPNPGKQMRNFNAIPSFSSEYVNAVIEIPAGTNKKYEYSEEKKMFLADYIDGKERIVDFLPYPGNYGFVPSTYLDPKLGGDGDAIDILVISESVPTGTMIEVIPIWIMYFDDSSSITEHKEKDPKIIAVPADPKYRVIEATTYNELQSKYPDIVMILERWFLSYKGKDIMKVVAWGDGDMAIKEIEKWQINR